MNTLIKAEHWEVTKLIGKCPPLTGRVRTVQDSSRGEKIFLYGGVDPGDETHTPQSYFHVCDMRLMEFSDLTNSLVYLPPGDPYSSHNLKPKAVNLPPISVAGMAFLNNKGHPMVYLFGGYDASEDIDGPSSASRLIAIHTRHKEWYNVDFEADQARPAAPRISPVLVAYKSRLYVFGGIKAFGDAWDHRQSYSIIEFVEKSHKCKWVAKDVPYPRHIPPFQEGMAIESASRILLLPGRQNCFDKIDFNHQNIFYFLPDTNTFEVADIKGELPSNVHWYDACKLERTDPRTSAPAPSVFIGTWIPYSRKYLSPEIWRLFVFPKDEIVSLRYHKKIFDLDVNFQRFHLVGNSMYLMGRGGDTAEDSRSDSGSDLTDEDAVCDTYIRIPL